MPINRAPFWTRLVPLCAMLLAALPALAGNVAFTYDTLDRLTGAVDGDGTVIEYSYDSAGNRTSHIVQAAANLTLTLAMAGTVGGGGAYAAGDPVTLTATPDVGSTFAGWGPSPCAASFTMPATDLTCTATFSLPTLKINNVRKDEGNSSTTAYTFTVTLSQARTDWVTVKYATANGTATAGSDYTAVPATLLTFSPGQTSKPVTVNVSGDTTPEANETFFVKLSAPTVATLFDGQGKGTLLNHDLGQVPNQDEVADLREVPDGSNGSEVAEDSDLEDDSGLADDSDLGPDSEQER